MFSSYKSFYIIIVTLFPIPLTIDRECESNDCSESQVKMRLTLSENICVLITDYSHREPRQAAHAGVVTAAKRLQNATTHLCGKVPRAMNRVKAQM
jgi:hypothetical protein